MSVATAKFFAARFNSSRSLVPTANPIPMIGPMRGEMSMAPIITAVELTFSPSDAMNMAKISTHRLAPLKVTPPVICSTISFSSSLSGMMLKYFFKTLKMLLFPISDVFVQN